MAKEIVIVNSRIIRKALKISDVIGDSGCVYGTFDSSFRIELMQTGGNPVIVFGERMGRGVQIAGLGNKKEILLKLCMPATKDDVELLYELTGNVCDAWGTENVFVDGQKVNRTSFKECIEDDINKNIQMLANADTIFGGMETLDLPCATLPISISIEQAKSFANNYEAFGDFLNDRQQILGFKSTPATYFNDENELCAKYVVLSGGPVILPAEAPKTIPTSRGKLVCGHTYITCPEIGAGDMDFETFLKSLPKDRIQPFDCKCVVVGPFSDDELAEILAR